MKIKVKDKNGTYKEAIIKGLKGDKGDIGDPKVYVGETPPTDKSIEVWFNNSEDISSEPILVKKDLIPIEEQLETKANELEVRKKTELIEPKDFSQASKEMMTGGSVAVVGGYSVDINNFSKQLQDDFGDFKDLTFSIIEGKRKKQDGTEKDEASCSYVTLSCGGGQRYKIKAITSENDGCYFRDVNGNFISNGFVGWEQVGHVFKEFEVPNGAVSMDINVYNQNNAYYPIYIKKMEYSGLSIANIDGFLANIEFEMGTIASSNGQNADNNSRIRSNFLNVNKGSMITVNEDIELNVFYYDNNDNGFISTTGFMTAITRYEIKEDSVVRIVLRNKDNSEIKSIEKIKSKFNLYYKPSYKVEQENANILNYYTSLDVVKKAWIPTGARNDITFVKNQLWIFDQSNDEGTDTALIHIYDFNESDNTFTLNRNINHNLGHCNAINYCESTNTLICGNGSGDYGLKGKIYIIENAYDRQSIMQNEIIVIDDSIDSLGTKYNVVWGESNCCEYDIAYLIVNDGKDIYKIQLGKDTNNLGRGQYRIPTVKFNGTYKICEHNTQKEHGYDYCVQGADYYNNKLVYGYGHNTGSISFKTVVFKNNEMIVEKYNIAKYKSDGTQDLSTISSITKYKDFLIVCSDGQLYFCKF